MLSRKHRDRALPFLITLLVVGLLLMTFDIRSEGEGVTNVLREGTQTIAAPLQKGAAVVVNPVLDVIDSLSNIANLREQNNVLRAELEEAQAQLIAVEDQLARLELFEKLYELEATSSDIGRTVAQVIGQPGAFSAALQIDKGSSSGIAVGQPVLDTSGFIVGTVSNVTAGTALIVPITVGRDGVAVAVGDQTGILWPQINTDAMRLEMSDASQPVFIGDRVVTSAASVRFPAGYPVGEVLFDAAPVLDALTTTVAPFAAPDTLRLVVVLAWPPDPTATSVVTTTTTTVPPSTTTTGGG